MRVIPAIAVFVTVGVSLYGQTTSSEAIIRAESNLSRIRALVEAGAMPKTALDRAEADIADARDEAVLSETLYGKATVQDLSNDQAANMLKAAQNQVERQLARVEDMRKLADGGVIARTEMTPLVEELDRRRRTLDLAQARMRLLEELAKMVQSEENPADDHTTGEYRVAEKFAGGGRFSMLDYSRISKAFAGKFGHALPVSAMGMTELHRSLGFDHSGRIDVALSPDTDEGRWLRSLLEKQNLPYFAFRAAVAGKATGAHIHMGPPSMRIRQQIAKGHSRANVAD